MVLRELYIFEEISNLKKLSLHHNKLSTVKGITIVPKNLFVKNVELEELTLGYNNLTEIPEGLFLGLVKLKKLSLYNKQEFDKIKPNTTPLLKKTLSNFA